MAPCLDGQAPAGETASPESGDNPAADRRPAGARLRSCLTSVGLHTAADICYGRAAAVQAGRAQVLDAAYHAHPERFVRKPPAPPKLPGTSWINPPQDKETGTQ